MLAERGSLRTRLSVEEGRVGLWTLKIEYVDA
jgi:hypothetical protein